MGRAAARLLDAAADYWRAYRSAGFDGAVVWVASDDGKLVVLTRGEYRQTIMANVDRLNFDMEDGVAATFEP